MKENTLFGHLAITRFGNQSENLATEALRFILTRSRTANQACMRYLTKAGINLPETLLFHTQVKKEDGSIPDLVGYDSDNEPVVVVESKFWAGLTDSQPVSYLQHLTPGKSGILLFLAPETRFATLWPDLLNRCKNKDVPYQSRPDIPPAFKCVTINEHHLLGLTSWRALLNYLLDALATEGDMTTASDVRQLLGLSAQMDASAFLPLHAEELSSQNGRRLMQYFKLMDEVTDIITRRENIFKKKTKLSHSTGMRRRYRLLNDEQWFFVEFNARYWERFRETPLWLGFYGKHLQLIRNALRKLEEADPPRLILDEGHLVIPLFILTGVEKDVVVENLVAQVEEVLDLLNTAEEIQPA